MIYYLIYKIQYDPFKDQYEKIVGFENKINDDALNVFTKPISIKPVENIGLTQHSCFYALLHPMENRLLTFDDMSDVLEILLSLNYTIDETLTKIEVKRRSEVVYVLRK
jgi:hypothetical protein